VEEVLLVSGPLTDSWNAASGPDNFMLLCYSRVVYLQDVLIMAFNFDLRTLISALQRFTNLSRGEKVSQPSLRPSSNYFLFF
jgi:hypothetical protein